MTKNTKDALDKIKIINDEQKGDFKTSTEIETDAACERFILLYTGDGGFIRLNIAASFLLKGETFIAGYEDDSAELCFFHVCTSKNALLLENVSDETYAEIRDYFLKYFIQDDGKNIDPKAVEKFKAPLAELLIQYSQNYFTGTEDLLCKNEESDIEDASEENAAVYSVYDKKGLRQTVVADFYADFSFPDEQKDSDGQGSFLDALDPELINMLSKLEGFEEIQDFCEGIEADFSHTGKDLAELEQRAERE